MRTLTLALAALGIATLGAPAHAAVDDPTGFLCSTTYLHEAADPPGTWRLVVQAGPLVLTDSSTGLPGSGTLTCTLQTDGPNHAGTGPSVSGHGTGAVVVGPAPVDLPMGPDDWFYYVCTEFTDDSDSTTYYWDELNGVWSTDPHVLCGMSSWSDPSEPLPPVDLLNSIVCPVLAVVFPPEGDVPGIWDCPPYGG